MNHQFKKNPECGDWKTTEKFVNFQVNVQITFIKL